MTDYKQFSISSYSLIDPRNEIFLIMPFTKIAQKLGQWKYDYCQS